jgi:hypothetical protein
MRLRRLRGRRFCFGFSEVFGEADGAIGGVVVAELFGIALAAGKTGAETWP